MAELVRARTTQDGVWDRDAVRVAWLHAVVEHTDMTLDDLRAVSPRACRAFTDEHLAALDALTPRDGESAEEHDERIKTDPLALTVRLADIQDAKHHAVLTHA